MLVTASGYVPLRITEYSSHNTILNNIFLSATASRAWVDIEEASALGMMSNYNVTTGVALVGGVRRNDWQSTYGFDTSSLVSTATALFVNPTAHNYRLLATSPARDAGTSLLAPAWDIERRARPQGPQVDIGAYEF